MLWSFSRIISVLYGRACYSLHAMNIEVSNGILIWISDQDNTRLIPLNIINSHDNKTGLIQQIFWLNFCFSSEVNVSKRSVWKYLRLCWQRGFVSCIPRVQTPLKSMNFVRMIRNVHKISREHIAFWILILGILLPLEELRLKNKPLSKYSLSI